MTLLTEPPAAPTSQPTALPPDFDWIDAPDGLLYELIDGRPVRKCVSAYSMWIATQIAFLLKAFVDERNLGFVFVEQPVVGVWQKARHGRRPDVCFVSKTRLAVLPPQGELEVAPELAVEVVSPHDNVPYLETKVLEYLANGVRLIWIVIPDAKSVRIVRQDGSGQIYNITQSLDGADVLPGFTCQVAELFPKA